VTNRRERQWCAARRVAVTAASVWAVLGAAACRQRESAAANAPPPIEIRATVRPAEAMTIHAQIDGQVVDLFTREGSAIAANAPVAQLANAAVQRDSEVTRAQLALIDARLRRPRTRAVSSPARPRDAMEITEKILRLRKERFDKMRALRATNDVTTGDLEQAEIEYLAALRDYNNERRGAPAGAPAGEGDRELLTLERQKTSAEERFATQRQSLLRITSPLAGVVTRLYIAPGQSVFPRDPIADVANVTSLQVRGTIAPELVRYVRPGMRVDVKILSIPVRTFADEIEAVLPMEASGTGARGGTIIVIVPNPDGSLQPNTEALITLRAPR